MEKKFKSKPWSSNSREELIKKATQTKYDAIIIGGGITGAGVARELSIRGYSFLLLEKNDFAFGTSSRSSKLIHGGLRYIANGQFQVTRESCTERNWLRNHVQHLVRPLAFNKLSYEDYLESPKKIKIGLKIYNFLSDRFSTYKNFAKPQFLSKEKMLEREPAIRKEKLISGAYYYDNNVDDARLTIETIKEALHYSNNHSIALNYMKVQKSIAKTQNHPQSVICQDSISSKEFAFSATQVINTTGIWADDIIKESRKNIRPSKGVHLIVPRSRVGNNHAFGIQSLRDLRGYFVLARGKFSIIGTTDTDYHGDINTPVCTKEECDYLLEGVNFLFPDAHLTEKDVISTYAGIRPLVLDPKAKSEGETSRKHVILDHPNGLVSLIGGKLTIFRLMGEELVFHLIKNDNLENHSKAKMKKKLSQKKYAISLSKEEFKQEVEGRIEKGTLSRVDDPMMNYLYQQYGKQAFEIMEIIHKNPKTGIPIFPDVEFSPAEIEWICDHEFAPCLLDVINRRTEMSLFIHHSRKQELAEKVGKIMQKKYNWSDERFQLEIQSYVDQVNDWLWF